MKRVFRYIRKNSIILECVVAVCLVSFGDGDPALRESIYRAHHSHKKMVVSKHSRDRRRSHREV